jgi:D-alanyl-lipoteichoic acid acyltransferase DltB (MBOAT superfamily)
LAGPIERASRLLPQLRNPAPLTTAMFHSAIGLLLIGYFKKLVIADRLDLFTNQISATPEVYSPFQVLAAPIITMYQYYCDFSGYADLAIGSALLMGITLSPNFNRPLAARSMSQMWFSWHITATVWFRDYLLVPLAGNRGRSVRRHACAVMLTGILIGLWHGASVGWLLVGCVIGILAVSEMINKKYFRKYRQPIQSPLGKALYGILAHFYVLFSFMFIIGTFITYDSSIQLQAALSNMAAFQFADMNLSSFIRGLTLFTKYDLVIIIVAIVGLEIWQWKYKTPHITQENTSFKGTHYGGYLLLICCILLFGVQSRPDFIYFQF